MPGNFKGHAIFSLRLCRVSFYNGKRLGDHPEFCFAKHLLFVRGCAGGCIGQVEEECRKRKKPENSAAAELSGF
jgi:hypothetical protein